jgi:hypothetical protein
MKKLSKCWAIIICAIVMVTLSGCANRPFPYQEGDDIPQGPGVFSGENGEFILYDSESSPTEKEKMLKRDKVIANDVSTAAIKPNSADCSPAIKGQSEFQKVEEWKKEKAEFKAFQRWKQSAKGSEAYRELLEWKQWRDFKHWQEQQNK